ncbi:MAG: TraR/DksA family transcriptional regulator [Pseudomonadota bacterium]
MPADPIDIVQARAGLLARKAELLALAEMSAESRSAVTLDQTSVGRVSRIDAIQAQQMALATDRKRDVEMTQIEAALTRIDDGDYGYCVVCDEPIAPRRLSLNPAVPTCIACAK